MEKLFKDGLYTELNDEFNSAEAIANLEEEVNNHPLKSLYEDDLAFS